MNPVVSPVGGSGLTGVTGNSANRMAEIGIVTTMTGIAQPGARDELADGSPVRSTDAHIRPAERARVDDEEPDEADVDEGLDADREEPPERTVDVDTEGHEGQAQDDDGDQRDRDRRDEDQERRWPLVRQATTRTPLDALCTGARDQADRQQDQAGQQQHDGAASVARHGADDDDAQAEEGGQPADDEERWRRPALDRERARAGPRCRCRCRLRFGSRPVGRGQRSGSGSCAGAFRLPLPAASGVRTDGRICAGAEALAAIRPLASRRLVAGSSTAAAISRRSKSLPHHAHSDQSIPTRRLQFGQTRFSRVRQWGR